MSRCLRYFLNRKQAAVGWTTIGAPASRFRVAALIIGIVALNGCASVRSRLSHRAAECSQLCEESRSARDAGRKDQAEQYLDAAIRRRPRDADTQLQLAEELWSSGRQLAAAEEVTKVLESSPNDIHAAVRLAQMQLEIGRTEAAYQAAQLAVRIDPACPEALRMKAILEERRGDTDAALTAALRLVDASPDDVEAVLQLAMLYRRRGQPNRAAPLLRSARQHSLATLEQREEAGWQLGLAYADSQRWADAQAAMHPVVHERATMTAEDWYQYALVESQCGHAEQAVAAAHQALVQQPKHPAANELARKLEMAGTRTAVLPAGFQTGAPARPQ
ncbi:MAG TPA: tetratricopeptide repeat protein [Planctomycetaceae bacterium]|nr:tetratricopeptide repeat protein [Planctomycetaceae bacterium]